MLAWFGLVALIVYLTFLGGGWQGIYSVQLRIFSLGLIVVGLAVWFVVAIVRPEWRPRSAIWPAFVVGFAAFGISLAASPTPRLGADYLAYAILLTALYLLFVRLMAHPFFRVRLTGLSVVLLVGLCVWYVVVVVSDWVGWWGMVGRIATPPLRPYFESLLYGNPSEVLTMAILLLAPAVAHIGFGSIGRRILVVVLTGLALFVTLLTGSRAGWLGLAIGIALTGVAWLVPVEHRRMTVRLLASWRVRMAGAALVVAGGIGAVIFGPAILARAGAGGEEFRAGLYATAVRMFQASPLLGTGPGTWVVQRPAYTLTSETDYYIPHAHDLYLQTIAEFGVLGAVAGVMALLCVAWLIRNGITDVDQTRRRFGWAALFSTTYFGAHQLLDFYPNMPAVLFAWVIPIAYLDATARRPILASAGTWLATRGKEVRPLAGVAGLALVVGAVAWLVRSEAIALEMDNGVRLANDGDWSGALTQFRAAATADPAMPPYQFALGVASADTGDLQAAEIALGQSARADNLPAAWLDLAAIRVERGDTAGARDALNQALRLGVQEAAINMGAGVVWLRLGDNVQATAAFALAVDQVPSLAGDPWWQSTPATATLWPAILDQAIGAAAPYTAFDIAVSAGDLDRARTIANQIVDPATRQLVDLVLPAWGGDQGAIDSLYASVSVRPLDINVLSWAARVAARSGDDLRADRFRTLAVAASNTNGFGFDVRVGTVRSSVNLAGIGSLFYGYYTYRRPTPWDELVMSLPQLVYQ